MALGTCVLPRAIEGKKGSQVCSHLVWEEVAFREIKIKNKNPNVFCPYSFSFYFTSKILYII
jgi:hypothetical protein